jgi:hypothetical protein
MKISFSAFLFQKYDFPRDDLIPLAEYGQVNAGAEGLAVR